MNKFAEFFQEANGTFSATRLAFLAWIFGALIGWGADTIHHEYKMAEIPQSVQILVAVLMTGKVTQKFGEDKSATDTAEIQLVEEKRQLIAHTDDNGVTQQRR